MKVVCIDNTENTPFTLNKVYDLKRYNNDVEYIVGIGFNRTYDKSNFDYYVIDDFGRIQHVNWDAFMYLDEYRDLKINQVTKDPL
jgi:hypothetical protein